jgi:DNA polymerase III sliding clamp (beta) subunit (PCNA family)
MSDPETGKTKIEFSDNKMTITTTHPIYGIAKEEMDIDYKGSAITVMCNYKAIADFLKVTSGRRIEFVINSQGSPMLFKAIGDENYIYISMPLKLYE